jgi:hypothetical protein
MIERLRYSRTKYSGGMPSVDRPERHDNYQQLQCGFCRSVPIPCG